ncbi:Cytochrome P450 9e2 [Folsomia candida]|uniref:Cytochrome P450 9e2 n=1 Tax=Folsomia candida TaxID=158441 RepID=A0A226E7M3_FOLCA|nr:Cytochrome P450 9e2 [Folsomia candida]
MSHTEKILSLIYFYFLLPVFTLYAYIVKNPKTQKYFESNGLLYLGDISSGYATDFLNGIGTTEIWTKLYNRVKQEKADFAGGDFIGHNFIIARKPSFIKSVLVKDASNFDRVHSLLSLKGDYIVSKSMVFMQGEDWKKTRAKFESAFTPSKVKRSFDQANQLGKNLVAYLNRELDNDSEKGIDFRIAAHKFSLDSAGSSTLSLDTASLQTREPSRFEQISAKFFLSFDNFTNWWKPGLIQLFPRIATYFKITVIDKEIVQFYGHIAKENMKNSGGDKNSNDFGGLVHSTWQELYWARTCKKEYAVPDTTLVLKAGDIIVIPLYGLHYDEEYHPNPEVFDPERFSGANKDFTFLPFSQGPRNCIGIRMAMVQTKMMLCHVLRNFKLTPSPETHNPMKFIKSAFPVMDSEEVVVCCAKIE